MADGTSPVPANGQPAGLELCLNAAFSAFDRQVATQPTDVVRMAAQVLDLRAPCQVFAFACVNPVWQGLIITHTPAAPHQQIRTFEGLQLWTASRAAEQVFKDPIWDAELPAPADETDQVGPGFKFRDVAFHALDTLLTHMRSASYLPPPERRESFWYGGGFSGRCKLLHRRGPLSEWKPAEYVDDVFRQAAADAEFETARKAQIQAEGGSTAAIAEPAVRRAPAHGAFIEPEIRIGHIQGTQIGHWYRDRDHHFPGVVVFRGKLGGHPLRVTHNGFLAVETDDAEEAWKWLNLAMAGLLGRGVAASIVRREELAEVNPPSDDTDFWGGSYPGRPRVRAWPWTSDWLSIEDLQDCLRQAEAFAETQTPSQLALLLEGVTHLRARAYTESFVYSWAIVEQAMTQRWDQFLNSKHVSGKRKEKLQGSDWTLHAKSEAMNLAAVFSSDLLRDLDAVRRVRNDIMHGDRLAAKGETEAALDLAERLLVGDGPRIRAPPRPSQAANLFETL